MTPTRERIVESGAELFRRQGFAGTGVKQIVTAARAPFGSLYHFFPGGKEELGAEAVRVSGGRYEQLIGAVFDPAPDLVSGVRTFFAAAAEHLRETDYEDACPIATVALEVSSTSETMRRACADVFESWINAGAERFERAGLPPSIARELTIGMLAALEGAFVLARAQRSIEPLEVAGELAASRIEQELGRTREHGGTPTPPTPPTPRTRPTPVPTVARVRPRLRARWPGPAEGQSPEPASP